MPKKKNSFEAALTWLKMRCRPTAALSHKKVGGGTNSTLTILSIEILTPDPSSHSEFFVFSYVSWRQVKS